MKKIIQKIALLLTIAITSGCGDDQKGDVISQDLNYEIDKDYVFVDIPPKFDFNPANIVYLQGKTILNISGKHDSEAGKTTITEGNTFQFNIKLKKTMNMDLIVRLKQDASLLNEHPNTANLAECPKDAYIIPDITLNKGNKEAIATLSFTNINALNTVPGYILPLRLELVDKKEGVIVSEINYSIFIHLTIELGKDNIDPSNAPIEGEEFNDIIVLESDYDTYSLEYLKDGELKYEYWSSADANTYLLMSLPKPTQLKGFKLVTANTRWGVRKFNMYVNEGKGFVSYGSVERETGNEPFYIKFKTPVSASAIKLDGILTANDRGAEIYEIYFIK